MAFDLRSKYNFDSTEAQITEGGFNSHSNCIPATFTAALDAAGFPDIPPQQITDEVYGPTWRQGEDFDPVIRWIDNHVGGVSFTHTAFDFDAAEAAGQAGQLIIIAGWIDAPSVTFVSIGDAHGFSHASLLVAHNPDDSFVIFNIWHGTFQTYSRDVMAASLYEMAVLHGGSSMSLSPSGKAGLVRLAFVAALGRQPNSLDELNARVAEIQDDGTGLDAVIDELFAADERGRYWARIDNARVPAGPAGPKGDTGATGIGLQGPKGDKGDPGKDGAPGAAGTIPPHKHNIVLETV